MAKSISFKYTISNQSFCGLPGEVVIMLCDATIHGWKTKRIWSDRYKGFTEEYAFFITYNNTEYGSLDFDDTVLDQGSCSHHNTGFFIFDIEFEEIFE